MTAVRRSTRAKRQAESIYDDAKRNMQNRESLDSERSRKDDDDDEVGEENRDGESTASESLLEEVEEDISSDESTDDEHNTYQRKTSKRISPKDRKKKTPKGTGMVPILMGKQPAGAKPPRRKRATQTRRGVQASLAALSRKVLHASETPENSLVASLLQSYKSSATGQRPAHNDSGTIYTTQLERVARSVIEVNRDDPNRAQTKLLNLLFRSVGGSLDTNIDPEETILEDMDSDEWMQLITELVDEMRHTPADRVLFCADPDGAVHAAAVEASNDASTVKVASSASGVQEYRKIYEEFWYILGCVALTEGYGDSQTGASGDTRLSTSRFDVEVVKDLIVRMTELVTVGQPDVRAAATVAALQLGHAVLNRTVELGKKLEVAMRQYTAASSGKTSQLSRKAESFRHQIDSLKRTRADLEEVVSTSLFQGVFMHRYRDSNIFIRAACLKALSKMTLQRPDLFLLGKYLKYLGWMLSDTAACVRVECLAGLKAPFLEKNDQGVKIDIGAMENVLGKFLPRIVDCTIDVSLQVQEEAMALLLAVAREGFLDDVDNDEMWTQINLCALAQDSSALVRRDALYFVLEQLDAFDEDDGDERSTRGKAKPSERVLMQRLDALASWVAHVLTDGPIPTDKVRIEVADYVVQSLRNMPEHKSLVTHWSGMISSIGDGNGKSSDDRLDVTKQRVLVRMLACAAKAEVGDAAQPDFLDSGDPEAIFLQDPDNSHIDRPKKGRSTKSYSPGLSHEMLSVSLLKSLPELLVKFKSDPAILESIAILPRYLLPSIFSLPQRKNEFTQLIKSLSDIYHDSSDERVLRMIATSLFFLSSGDHVRATDAHLCLQRMTSSLYHRLLELLEASNDRLGEDKSNTSKRSSKRRSRDRGSPSSHSSTSTGQSFENDGDADLLEIECSISLCLKRLLVLGKRINVADLLDDDKGGEQGSEASRKLETLLEAIAKNVAAQLNARKVVANDEGDKLSIPEVWTMKDKRIHGAVTDSIKEALSFLLVCLGWEIGVIENEDGVIMASDGLPPVVQEEEEDAAGDEVDHDHPALLLRDRLASLLLLCFDQYLEEGKGLDFSDEHIEFSSAIQIHAGKVSSDLRTLLPRWWESAASPLLRGCALTRDGQLIGGFARYFGSQEDMLRALEEGEADSDLPTTELLYPMARCVAFNWLCGNRREAGIVLAHITGSGEKSSKIVATMSRLLKKVGPVRLLEAHMASLRQSYEAWVRSEPEEIESDRPSDEEMAAYEDAERRYAKQFAFVGHQASRLSMSLGVGKLSDPKLTPSLLGFVLEGIRFAFSYDEDDTLIIGSRLSFLSILSKYVTWFRHNEDHQIALREALDEREADFREHPDFEDANEEDLAAIAAFREAVGFKELGRNDESPRGVVDSHSLSDESLGGGTSTRNVVGMTTSPSVDLSSRTRRRLSKGSSVGSVRSRLSSTQNSLSPLPEEDATMFDSPVDDEATPSPAKRRRFHRRNPSFESSISLSTLGKTQGTIEEGSGESASGSE